MTSMSMRRKNLWCSVWLAAFFPSLISCAVAQASSALFDPTAAGSAFNAATKEQFLSWRKSQALAELESAGVKIPADFLRWIDSDPVVYRTVYGVQNPSAHGLPVLPKGVVQDRTDTPAQRLVVLRSLEIDLGAEVVRQKYPQLALTMMHAYAGRLARPSYEDAALGVSWKARPLLKLEVPNSKLVPVDTRAKNRPLDLNDHLINFLDEHAVPETPAKGAAVDPSKKRPLYAYEVMNDPTLQAQLLAYLKERGHAIQPKQVTLSAAGFALFSKAYLEKGRIPKEFDPAPTPAEKMAYLVRNDQYRFPPDVKRTWPRFELNSPWPVLEYLASGVIAGDMPLRDREYVWSRFRDQGTVRKYGKHLGAKLGLNTPMVRARKLMPFPFAFGSYAMDVKDNGACREMARIGIGTNTGLGVPSTHAFQPGHFCLVSIGYAPKSGYTLNVEQHVRPPTWVTKGGVRREDEFARLIFPLNYGLDAMLDAMVGFTCYRALPSSTTASQRQSWLESLLDINPYSLEIPRELFEQCATPQDVAKAWTRMQQRVKRVDRVGCPPGGIYTDFTLRRMVDGRLKSLPVPNDPAVRAMVVKACLETSADPLWMSYVGFGWSQTQWLQWAVSQLRASLGKPRNQEQAALFANRLTVIGKSFKDDAVRKQLGMALLHLLRGRETFQVTQGGKTSEMADPSLLVAQTLAGQTPDARAAVERDLRAGVHGDRSPTRADVLAKRLATAARAIREPKLRKAWAETLHAVILGRETYITPQQPDKPQLDPAVREIYALGVDLQPAAARFASDFTTYLRQPRTPVEAKSMELRLQVLLEALRPSTPAHSAIIALVPHTQGMEMITSDGSAGKAGKKVPDPAVARLRKYASSQPR